MRTTIVKGSGDVRLSVHDWGPEDAQPILFIHGWSQSYLSWKYQIGDALPEFRVVALDLRGHGSSEAPSGASAYDNADVWAQDVEAVISQLGLVKPILVGWSFGGYVVCDYVRAYGQSAIAGINFVSWAVMIGNTAKERALTGDGFNDYFDAAVSSDLQENITAMRGFVRACSTKPLSDEDFEEILAYNMIVTPLVRRAVATRGVLDNSGLLSQLTVPVLVTQGTADCITKRAAASHIVSCSPMARESIYEGVGHLPFIEERERYNDELAQFAREVSAASDREGG